jgi:hypothetical protein
MSRKLTLLKRAAKAGWVWAWDYSDHVGRVLTFAALLVGTGSVSAVRVGWWGPVVAIVVFALFALAAGALNEWDKAEQRIEGEEKFQKAMADFQRSCYEHIAGVERFLKVREIETPPGPSDLATALRTMDRPEAKKRRDEAERHERETVAQFLASDDLDRGLRLFDFLIEWGYIVDTTRPQVAEPRDVFQIRDGLASIRIAAERLPVTSPDLTQSVD